MIKLIILSSFILLLNGCSQKLVSNTPQCQNIELEMSNLEKERNLNTTAKAIYMLGGSYPTGKSSKELDEKIKLLNFELRDCNKLKEQSIKNK